MSSYPSTSYMRASDENHPYHDTPTSSSSNSFSTSSSCSSPDIQRKEYALLNKTRRKKRTFIPDEKKDPVYWSQRSKNNLSAKRSRAKRRMNDLVLETKLTQLNNENQVLKAKIDMLARKFGHLTNSEEETQEETAEKTNTNASEQTQLINLLDTSPTPKVNLAEEQSLLDKTSTTVQPPMPIKWRFKLFNMTSNS